MDRQTSQARYVELVEKARRGDKQSLNELAALARERLQVYVYRLTQNQDLSQEIVQESLFEMCRVLGKLKQTERFWSWLYGIATNKLHRHHRTERALRNAAASEERRRGPMKERQGGLESLVSEELRQIVSKAMQKLRTRHKAVLVMRCYDDMSYAEIADSMGCTEFSTRMLFVRAKRALQKELSRNGFSKGSLLAALVVFGKMTAPSEAAAAQLTVPLAATKAGVLASLATLATTKTAIVSVATVGALTVGTITTTSQIGGPAEHPAVKPAASVQVVSTFQAPDDAAGRYWYYFPDGPDGPVMLRAELGNAASGPRRQFLQNDQANYAHQGGSVAINNHRVWSADLSVMRLPTDGRTLTNFLTRVEGKTSKTQRVSAGGRDLLVTVEHTPDEAMDAEKARPTTVRHDNVLEEDYFRSDWPATAKRIDNRDAMHVRGWTYFRVRGQIGAQNVQGAGRIPFVYAASKEVSPWLKLQIGETTLVDGNAGAMVLASDGTTTTRYAQGSFFLGLSRPWMGLHTMDLVRRDAAEQRIEFETEMMDNGRDVQVTLLGERTTLVYTIDLVDDLVRAIELRQGRETLGQLEFEYLQDIDTDLSEFETPSGLNDRVTLRKSLGITWLTQLAEGAFTK